MDKVITKKKNLILKCIAVSLMVVLHTFGFPNRIANETYISLGNINGKNIELLIANFGSSCVGMFLFLSGYGMYQTYNEDVNYKGILRRILNLYKNYWCVFLVFIPLGILIGEYQFNLQSLVLNFFALSSSYNAEWWFLRLYIMLVLLYPLILKLLITYSNKKILLISFIGNILGFIITKISYIIGVYPLIIELICILLGGQFLFILAISISKNAYFDSIERRLKWSKFTYKMLLIIYIPLMAIIIDIPVIGEIMKLVCIPIFIFLVANSISKNRVMEWIGKHSTNIWLIHSFFCYYLFPSLTFVPRYSVFIFIWIMLLSISCSYLIFGIREMIKISQRYTLKFRKSYIR